MLVECGLERREQLDVCDLDGGQVHPHPNAVPRLGPDPSDRLDGRPGGPPAERKPSGEEDLYDIPTFLRR